MYLRTKSSVIPAIRHKESNWAKFLMQDLKNAVCAPEHLFHRVGTEFINNSLSKHAVLV